MSEVDGRTRSSNVLSSSGNQPEDCGIVQDSVARGTLHSHITGKNASKHNEAHEEQAEPQFVRGVPTYKYPEEHHQVLGPEVCMTLLR